MSEQCGEPYPHLGDIRACPLDAWHDDTCEHANHLALARSASRTTRIRLTAFEAARSTTHIRRGATNE